MVSRRAVLATVGALVAAGLAGCDGRASDPTSRHYVDVLNSAREPHRFAVTAVDDDGQTLFEHVYDLEPRSGDENRLIEGTPAVIRVRVDGADPVEIQWAPLQGEGIVESHPNGCSEATSPGITIYYGTESPGEIGAVYSCETVSEG